MSNTEERKMNGIIFAAVVMTIGMLSLMALGGYIYIEHLYVYKQR